MSDFTVDPENVFSPATADEASQLMILHYMEKLRIQDGHALGFLPFSAMRESIASDRVLVEMENGSETGFLLWGRKKNRLKVFMIAIQQDNRRIYHARNLLLALFSLEQNRECEFIQLRCAEDLEANYFWASVGFTKVNCVDGGKLRPDLIRPRPGSDDYAVARALGKGILLKAKKRKNPFRQINIWRMLRETSSLWTGQDTVQPVTLFPLATG